MQRIQGWVRYASQGAGGNSTKQQQQQDDDEEDFIYGRVAVHSDDEEQGEHLVCVRLAAWQG